MSKTVSEAFEDLTELIQDRRREVVVEVRRRIFSSTVRFGFCVLD